MTWLRHVRRAVLTGLTWGVLWAPLGVFTGSIWGPTDLMDEPWIALGAYPGFLCGLVFCAVLAIADGHHRLDELSPSRAGAWGAFSGLLVMALPMTGLLGTPNAEHPFWQWRFVIVAAVIPLSSISALGSVLLARTAHERELGGGLACGFLTRLWRDWRPVRRRRFGLATPASTAPRLGRTARGTAVATSRCGRRRAAAACR